MPAPVQTTTTMPIVTTTPLVTITTTTTMPVVTTTTSTTPVAPETSPTTTMPVGTSVTTQKATVISTNVAPLSANSSMNTMPEQTTSQLHTSTSSESKSNAPIGLFVIIGILLIASCTIIALISARRRN